MTTPIHMQGFTVVFEHSGPLGVYICDASNGDVIVNGPEEKDYELNPEGFHPILTLTPRTGKVEEKVLLVERSDDWVIQFALGYNEDGQRKNGPFPVHIATTGKGPDKIMFLDKLKSAMWLERTHLTIGREPYRVIHQNAEHLQQVTERVQK